MEQSWKLHRRRRTHSFQLPSQASEVRFCFFRGFLLPYILAWCVADYATSRDDSLGVLRRSWGIFLASSFDDFIFSFHLIWSVRPTCHETLLDFVTQGLSWDPAVFPMDSHFESLLFIDDALVTIPNSNCVLIRKWISFIKEKIWAWETTCLIVSDCVCFQSPSMWTPLEGIGFSPRFMFLGIVDFKASLPEPG